MTATSLTTSVTHFPSTYNGESRMLAAGNSLTNLFILSTFEAFPSGPRLVSLSMEDARLNAGEGMVKGVVFAVPGASPARPLLLPCKGGLLSSSVSDRTGSSLRLSDAY
jgi:hypothetical protein